MKFVPVWIHSGYGRPVKSHFCSCGFLENRWRKTVENKKFPNRCQKMNTNLEKIKRTSKSVFSSFYWFFQTKHASRVNAKTSFLELQLRKFNSFCSFLVCSISYRFYNYPKNLVKMLHLFPRQKLEASFLVGYKSPLF